MLNLFSGFSRNLLIRIDLSSMALCNAVLSSQFTTLTRVRLTSYFRRCFPHSIAFSSFPKRVKVESNSKFRQLTSSNPPYNMYLQNSSATGCSLSCLVGKDLPPIEAELRQGPRPCLQRHNARQYNQTSPSGLAAQVDLCSILEIRPAIRSLPKAVLISAKPFHPLKL